MMPWNPVIMDRWGRNRGSTITAGHVMDYKLRLVGTQFNIDSKYSLCRTWLDGWVKTKCHLARTRKTKEPFEGGGVCTRNF